MAYALVAHTQKITGTTPAIDTTGATLLIAYLNDFSALNAPTDSKSNTWTPLTLQHVNVYSNIYYAKNPTVGAGHTFSTGAGIVPVIYVAAFSGADTTAPFDNENGVTGFLGVSSQQPGSITPSNNGELVVTGIGLSSNPTSGSITIDSGFTITDSNLYQNAVNFGGGLAYLVQGSAAAINPTWSWTGNTTELSANIASFIAGASAAAAFTPMIGYGGGAVGPDRRLAA